MTQIIDDDYKKWITEIKSKLSPQLGDESLTNCWQIGQQLVD